MLINLLNKLPDAVPDDKYWTLSQLVNRRDNINIHQQRLKNQLHEQLCMAYPSYKKFFQDIGRPTALYFFHEYPSPVHLRGKTAEELAGELRPVSHNNCSVKRAEKILELVKSDGETCRDCQESRDIITRSLAYDLEHYRKQMELAKFAGIAPINFSSAGKGKDMCPKQGNRRLQEIFYFLAIQMVQVAPSGTPRNALFREYFLKKLEEGKNKPQALICIARRLVNIVYGMLKNHTEYREPQGSGWACRLKVN